MGKRNQGLIVLAVILGAVVLLDACHKKAAAPPPPPAPAPAPIAPPAPIVSLTAEPATVEKGHSVTLSWTSQNATTLDLQPQAGKVEALGSMTVTPQESTTYVITATGPGGTTTDSARVTVTIPPPPPPPPKTAVGEVTEEQMFETQVKDAYFDFDRADIRSDAQQTLTANAEFFKAHPELTFTIEGHCDERGSEEYNLALGERRALSGKTFLVNLGIPDSRIVTISYGKERPQCIDPDETCWQKNRRVHFKMGREGR